MKKGLLSLAVLGLAAGSLCGITSCDSTSGIDGVKVGFIFLHDETSSYDKNFIDAAKSTVAALGLSSSQVIYKTGIAENDGDYDAAADLVDQGCNVIFADSFGHESAMLKAAKEFPNVQFCHATGTQAHTANVANYHNTFADIYQGRYLTGIVAGMKINEMIAAGTITADEAVMGYVGAYPYAEVVSGYTSFYLGAKSVCDSVTMSVRYTNSWYDVTAEQSTANALIKTDHAVIISQHADSQGAPSACEAAGVPNVFYNGTNLDKDTYLVASRINWVPYFTYMLESVRDNVTMPSDYCGTIANGAVEVLTLNDELAAEGTAAAIETATTALKNKTIHVFDTSKFTVDGAAKTSYLADVDDDGTYVGETEVISGGYFHESEYRSAPYFDLRIDGITEKTSN
ncbi:MAG: BMP family ABC transporter substrate-binding protein [Bacilli bacterium]